jgi:hypothetical protein
MGNHWPYHFCGHSCAGLLVCHSAGDAEKKGQIETSQIERASKRALGRSYLRRSRQE